MTDATEPTTENYSIAGLTEEQTAQVQDLLNKAVLAERERHVKRVLEIKDYKPGDLVSVFYPKTADYIEGRVSELSELNTRVHVDTDRGPLTIMNPKRISPLV